MSWHLSLFSASLRNLCSLLNQLNQRLDVVVLTTSSVSLLRLLAWGMNHRAAWGSYKARRVLAALLRIGWIEKRHPGGSHRTLSRPSWPDYTFAFHDNDTLGPAMMARVAKHTGLKPSDL